MPSYRRKMDDYEEFQMSWKSKLITAFSYSLLWISLLTFLAGWLASGHSASVLFTWHPMLMVTSFVLFFGHGILIYRSPYRIRPLGSKRMAHGMLQTAGLFTALLGLTVILVNKIFIAQHSVVPDSVHSYFGIVTLACVGFQGLIGIIKVCLPRSPRLLKLHGPFGVLILLSAIATICMGIYHFVGQSGTTSVISYVQMALLCAFGVMVVIQRSVAPWPHATNEESVLAGEKGEPREHAPLLRLSAPQYPYTV